MEMNFCRRCGTALTPLQYPAFTCHNGHTIFNNASAAIGLILVNDKKETLVVTRAIEPGKGLLDMGGGFCDGAETLENAITRETLEEVGLKPGDYTAPQFILSHIDPYEYKGETLPVLSVAFWARVKSDAQPQPADDVASIRFLSYADINLNKAYFASYREALQRLHDKGII